MALVRYQGRKVTAHWYRRYVLAAYQRSLAAQRQQCHTIFARFHLPEVRCTRDPAETRTVNLHNPENVRWVREMCEGYAAIQTLRPTFFPDHP